MKSSRSFVDSPVRALNVFDTCILKTFALLGALLTGAAHAAPLELSAVANPDPVVAGGIVTYELTVSNVGTALPEGTTVSFVVPDGVRFSRSLPHPDAVCEGAVTCVGGLMATWVLGPLASGQSRSIRIPATVAAGVADGTVIALDAQARFESPLILHEAAASASVVVESTPGLALVHTASAGPVVAGETLRYTLDVSNPTNTARDDVVLAFELPAGTTLLSAGGGTLSNGTVSFALGQLLAGKRVRRELQVTVDAAAANGTLIEAHSSVSEAGSAQAVARAGVTRVVRGDSPLGLSVVANPDPVAAGALLTYELTVSNRSATVELGSVELSFEVPRQVSFNRSRPSQDAVCEGAVICVGGHTARFDLGLLTAGQSRTVRVPASVAAGLANGELIALRAQVTYTGMDAPAHAAMAAVVHSTPGLALVHTASPGPVASGETLRYTLDVSNPTNVARDDVELAFEVPAGTTLLSAGGGTPSNGTVSFALGQLLAGKRVRRELQVTVDAAAPNGTLIEAHSSVSEAGSAQAVARAGVTRVVRGDSPLGLSVVANPDPVAAGALLTYELTVSNRSATVELGSVELSFEVPPEVSFNRARPSQDAVCEGAVICVGGHTARFNLGLLTAGQSRTVRVPASVAAGLANGELIALRAQVTYTGMDAPGQAAMAAVVHSTPGLALVHTASPGPVASGETLRYTLDVSNPTNAARDDVELAFEVPAGTTLLSAGGGTASNGTVSFALGQLLAGKRVRRELQVTVDAAAPNGTLIEAHSSVREAGSAQPVARAGVTRAVRGDSPLGLSVVANPDPVAVGALLTYELTVSNRSATVELGGVELSFEVPPQVSFSRSRPSQDAVCEGAVTCVGGHTARFNLGLLTAGQSRTVRVPANVAAGLANGELIALRAQVTYAGMDAPGQAAMAAVVHSTPGLGLVHTASPGPLVAGETLRYTLDVSNPTNVARDDVELAFEVPAGTTLLSAGGGTASNGTVSFALGRLLAGERVRRQLEVTVDAAAANGTLIEAHSSVSEAGGADAVVRAGVTRMLRGDSPLGLSVVANPDPVAAGGTLTYIFSVVNTAAFRQLDNVVLGFQLAAPISFNRGAPDPDAFCEGSVTCVAGHTALFQLGTLAPGANATVTVPSTVVATARPGTLILLKGEVAFSGFDAPVTTSRVVVVDPTLRGLDTDGDGLTDEQEIALGTLTNVADTDGDGLLDGVEVGVAGFDADPSTTTNPLNPDTDGDGLLDGYNGVNPACEDCNNNGALDPGETNPLLETQFPACAPLDVAAGFNIIAHPSPAPALGCFGLLDALTDFGARALQRFDITRGEFVSCAVQGDPGAEVIVGVNFPIRPGTGYLLQMQGAAQIEMPGCILPRGSQ